MRGMVAQATLRSSVLSAALLVLALASACGGDEGGSSAPAPATDSSSAEPSSSAGGVRRAVAKAESSGEEPYDSAELGALHGEILFTGTAPERFTLGAAQTSGCRDHPDVDQRSNEVVVADGKLVGAYVYLKSGFDPAQIPAPRADVVTLEQKGCMYVPRVLALRVGQTLQVTNGDPTAHNVHARGKRNGELNKSMGAAQAPLEFRFEKAERPVPFKCDIHPWMGAAVFVEEHPWFAVSDAQGRFTIRDVPPGEYVVEVVHERLGETRGSATVTAGRSSGVVFRLAGR